MIDKRGNGNEDAPMEEQLTESLELSAGIEPTQLRVEMNEARAQRFYDRVRASIVKYVEARGLSLGRTREYLLLVPDVFILLFRLSVDARVSRKNKALLASGIAYFIFPLDFVPEIIVGPIGFLDDLVFGVFVLNRVLAETDADILREHWSGEGDVLEMIRNVLGAADGLVASKFVRRIKKLFD